MARHKSSGFSAVRTEGALLSHAILSRAFALDKKLVGTGEAAYGFSGLTVNEAAASAYNALCSAWSVFSAVRNRENVAPDELRRATRVWVNQVFRRLDYGTMPAQSSVVAGDTEYPITHLYAQNLPIIAVACDADLDRETRTGGVKRRPHTTAQSLLNASDDYLWAFVTNGLRWRILRDDNSLSRQSLLEFDLEAIFEGQLYTEFLLFFIVCHQSRFAAVKPEEFIIEKWHAEVSAEGKRALDTLRESVKEAISQLGQGFLRHPENADLRAQLVSGSLDKQDYYRQLLRMVYRLIFLFKAEDRGLLFHPEAPLEARKLYTESYSTARLRALAIGPEPSERYADLYCQLQVIIRALSAPNGCPELGLRSLGSFLFSASSVSALDSASISNRALRNAIRSLAFTTEGGRPMPVNYRDLGSEELGSVYESLLELHPELSCDGTRFTLALAAGNERKTTGSYYTPDSLIQCLLDSALEPVAAEALRKQDPEKAILALRICDPACGSGHFLIAAAHRLAARLATVRAGGDEPGYDEYMRALRDIIGNCIYGVDINPMSVELCKVSLWMEALDPARPLSFLDHHIQCGNSLLGTTPGLMRQGIPEGAFTALNGDDKDTCAYYKARNKRELAGHLALFGRNLEPWEALGDIGTGMAQLSAIEDDTVEGIVARQAAYERTLASANYENGKLLADM